MHVTERTPEGLECYTTWNFLNKWGCVKYGLFMATGIFPKLPRKEIPFLLSANFLRIDIFWIQHVSLALTEWWWPNTWKTSVFNASKECGFACWCAASNTSQFPKTERDQPPNMCLLNLESERSKKEMS